MNPISRSSPLSYAYAQDLNECAAMCVELGHYDKAIVILSKSLQLWKERNARMDDVYKDSQEEACVCPRCTPRLDRKTRVPTSKDDSTASADTSEDEDAQQRRRTQQSDCCENFHTFSCCHVARDRPASSEPAASVDDGQETTSSLECYLYQKLLRVPCRKRFGNHNVHSVVPLVSIFNLAIVHQKCAVLSNSRPIMTKTLQLYKVANDALHRYIKDSQTTHPSCQNLESGGSTHDIELGLLFQMILLNNLSHLHSFMGDEAKGRSCIEQLIPIVMCVVDDKVRNSHSDSIVSDNASATHHEWPATNAAAETSECPCLEGFFRNISPLVLTSQCADAA